MGEESTEAVQPSTPSSPAKGAEASRRSATTSLVLGIASIVLLLAFVISLVASFDEEDWDARFWILYLVGLVAAICAISFGQKGRRLAMDEPGRVKATWGLVLGTVFIVGSVVGVIVMLIALSIVVRNDVL